MTLGKTQTDDDVPNETPQSIQWLPLVAVAIGSFLGPLAGSIVNVALPAIAGDFHTDIQSVKWVILVYLAVGAALLPVAGRIGTRIGEERLYFYGFAIFAVGSTLCALTPPSIGMVWLTISRVVQSLGATALFAVSLAVITRYIPASRRSFVFGIIGSVVSIALITGPPLGVVISDTIGWRSVFWVQVPVALLGAIFAVRMIRRPDAQDAQRFPWQSAVAWFALICGLTLIGETFSKGLWIDRLPEIAAITGAALLLFSVAEYRSTQLFLYRLFTYPAFWRGAIISVTANLTILAVYLLVPFFLDDFLGLGMAQRGMLFAISPLCTVIVGPLAGGIADKIGFRLLIFAGLGVFAASYIIQAYAVATGSITMLGIGFAAIGIGSGLLAGPCSSAMMGCVATGERAIASSFVSLMRNLGFLLGVSLASVWLGMFLAQLGGSELMMAARQQELATAVSLEQFSYAFSRVLVICAVLCLAIVFPVLGFPNRVTALQDQQV